jgi:hypothetical protein
MVGACGRDIPSGLDFAADSIAASQPIVPDTVRSSARRAIRLDVVREVVIPETADTASPAWLGGTSQIAIAEHGFALFSGGNLKYFDSRGKHVWSTSRYDFAPGQLQNAKRSAFGGRGAADVGDWIDWMVDKDSFAPGAITYASSLDWTGDTLVIQSGTMFQLYNRAGRSLSMFRANSPEGGRSVSYFGASPAGWMLSLAREQALRPGQRIADSTIYSLRRVSLRNGALGPPLGRWTMRRANTEVAYGPGGARRGAITPLVRATPFQTIGGGKWVTSSGENYQLEIHDEYGRLARVIIVDSERVPVTSRLLDSLAENSARRFRERAASGDSSSAEWLREVLPQLRALPVPSHRPPIMAAWVGDDGSIAVRRADVVQPQGSDSLHMDVIGVDGRYRGRVVLPQPGVTILRFTGNAFYVAEKAGSLRGAGAGTAATTDPTYNEGGRIIRVNVSTVEIEYQRLVRYSIGGGG